MTSAAARAAILLAICACSAPAVEIHIQFGALEHMLADQVFTQEGRRYVHGDKNNKCNFAYLEKPQVQGGNGRLLIRARFTGRTALNMFGQCVGLGDAFFVVIAATPQYRDGNIGLRDVAAAGDGKTGFYIRRVCAALSSSLAHDFRYPIAAEMQKMLEAPGNLPAYRRELRKFTVSDLHVAADALVIALDFELTVK